MMTCVARPYRQPQSGHMEEVGVMYREASQLGYGKTMTQVG